MINASPASSRALLLILFLGLPIVLGGLVAQPLLPLLIWNQARSLNWKPYRCKIVQLKAHGFFPDPNPDIRYQYVVNGKEYESSQIYLIGANRGSENAGRKLCELLEHHRLSGKPMIAYVNLHDPRQSVLYRGGSWRESAEHALHMLLLSGAFGWLIRYIAMDIVDRWQASRLMGGKPLPWQVRVGWIKGEIRVSDRPKSYFLLMLGLFAIPRSIPSIFDSYFAWQSTPNDSTPLIGVIPFLVAMGVVVWGIVVNLRWQRHGDSLFRLASTPASLGAELVGVVHIEKPLEASNGFHVRLQCKQRLRATRSEPFRTEVIWEHEQAVLRGLTSSDHWGTNIPVCIGVPYPLPHTEITNDLINCHWLLTVSADSHPVPYRATFEIPVFVTENSDPHFHPSELLDEEFLAPVDLAIPLQEVGILYERKKSGDLHVTFPRGRNRFLSASITAVQLSICAILVVAAYFLSHVAVTIFATLSCAAVGLYLVDLNLFHSEIEVNTEGIRWRYGYCYLGPSHWLAQADVAILFADPSTALTPEPLYHIKVKLKSGNALTLAKRIGNRFLTNQAIMQIYQTLFVDHLANDHD